jgi:ferredoxin
VLCFNTFFRGIRHYPSFEELSSMERYAGSLFQRARKRFFPWAGHGDVIASRPDPTEAVRAYLRSGQLARTDGLDDYDGDFSANVSSAATVDEPLYSPAAERSEKVPPDEPETPDQEPACRDEGEAASTPQSETAQAVPCEMIRSRGRTLIVGEDETALREHADRLSGEQECLLLLTGTGQRSPRLSWSGGHACLFCPEVRISGVFGHFRPAVSCSGEMLDAGEIAFGEPRVFDLVLDLTSQGCFATPRPPLGYYWPHRPEDLEVALDELPAMRGRFEKQHFISLVPQNCAHGHAGRRGCSRCIEACPYGALGAGKEAPVVDHLLCQGCLACVSACPTGAMEPLLAGRDELLARMEEAIARGGEGGAPPVLLLHREESDPDEALERVRDRMPAVTVSVEAPGLLGAECLLAALALGAAGVVVQKEGPEGKVLQSQVRWARTVLRALGRSPDRVQLGVAAERIEPPPPTPPLVSAEAKDFANRDKRTTLTRAVQRIGIGGPGSREVWEMPADACLGAVSLRGELCTLCMACAGACPTRALNPGGEEQPGIRFTESRCVQCGLCARVCPEGALSLLPRLSPDHLAEDAPVWLHREEPEKCRACGRPFASAGMLQKIRSTLGQRRGTDDPEWLTMCGECRVRTLFREQEDSP